MRLWSLNPKYLDSIGIAALWREALLAQKVIEGRTRGYIKHPQLTRFKNTPNPMGAIAAYLKGIYTEASGRYYHFDASKINASPSAFKMTVTKGQLLYELSHLKSKLKKRNPRAYFALKAITSPDAHPLFKVINGPIEDWERVRY